MEREYRKFKRTIRPDNYGNDFKKQMDIRMFNNKRYVPLELELKCEIARRSALSKTIRNTLPKDVQYKGYTFEMNNYNLYLLMYFLQNSSIIVVEVFLSEIMLV